MKAYTVYITIALVLNLTFTGNLMAQGPSGHVVSLGELRSTLVEKSAERAANIQEVQKLLRHEQVQKRFGAMADLEKIAQVLPTLDDATLQQLAADSRKANDQIQAGLGTVAWVVIVIGIIFLILVIAVVSSGPDTIVFPAI